MLLRLYLIRFYEQHRLSLKPSMEKLNGLKNWVVVMRGPSAVTFLQGDSVTIQEFPTSIGNVNIKYATRWLKHNDDLIVPGHLWIR